MCVLMQGEKLRQCILSREPEHEQVGKVQLYINYSTTPDENSYKVYYIGNWEKGVWILWWMEMFKHFQA